MRSESKIDLSNYQSRISYCNKFVRVLWQIVWLILFRPSPVILHSWRRFLLRIFGARIGKGAHPYPSARIWAPWNLEMGDYSCLGHYVDCYCVDEVKIGNHVTVSQYSYLCTASHDIEDPKMRLIIAPIIIEDGAWITAGVYIGPGITVGEGAVLGAHSVVVKDVEPWTVVAGNPARFIKNRKLTK